MFLIPPCLSFLWQPYLALVCQWIRWVHWGGGIGLCCAHGSVASHGHSVGSFKAPSDPLITCHVHRHTQVNRVYGVLDHIMLLGKGQCCWEWLQHTGLDSCLGGCCVKVTSTWTAKGKVSQHNTISYSLLFTSDKYSAAEHISINNFVQHIYYYVTLMNVAFII